MRFYKGNTFDHPEDGHEYRIVNLGEIHAAIPFGGNIFRDVFSSVRDVVGGKIGSTKKLIDDAIEEGKAELAMKAEGLGGKAVINFSIDFEFGGKENGIVCVVVSGDVARFVSRPVA